MSASLDGPRRKIERADQHLAQLEAAIQRYHDDRPYEVVRDTDPNTGILVYRFRIRQPPPPELPLLAGDAIHNLRSALDLLWCQLVVANGKEIAESDTFPIANSEDRFEKTFRGVKQRIPAAARPMLQALKPYEGGHNGLWRLHKLDVIDKHRLLLAVWAATQGVVLRPRLKVPWQEGMWDTRVPIPIKQGCLEDGEMIAATGPILGAGEHGNDPEFTIGIALDEPPIVECEPLLPTLTQLRGAVEQVIDLFAPILTE
jgi:hypothetical protein